MAILIIKILIIKTGKGTTHGRPNSKILIIKTGKGTTHGHPMACAHSILQDLAAVLLPSPLATAL